jgi:hypothetical protein
MRKITQTVSAIMLITVFLAAFVRAACYSNGTYTCHSADSGCNGWFAGGNCFFCNCTPPAMLGGPKCWWSDTAGTVTRATGNAYGSGLNNICYNNTVCTWTRTTWDCFGNASATVHNEAIQASSACGTSC